MPKGLTPADILRARARTLAQVPPAAADVSGMLDILEFRLAHERFAVETRCVREVLPLRHLTPLPGTPPFLVGIVNVRGELVPVIDIKRFFDLPDPGITDLHQVILLQSHGVVIGLLADTTVAVRSVAASTVQPALPTLTGIRAEYLQGVTADRLVILDADRLAAAPALSVQQEPDADTRTNGAR